MKNNDTHLIHRGKSFLSAIPRVFLGRLRMGGGQVQGDKVLMGGTHEGRHRPYGGDLTLIDYIIN